MKTTSGKTYIITGGNSGLGYQCALNIAKANRDYHVIIACRNPEKGKKACQSLLSETGNNNVTTLALDLASLESVRVFYKTFSDSNYPPLHGLVCNAATSFSGDDEKTKEGIDATFGVNHLGHFLLSNLLLNQMVDNNRIVFVSSDRHNPYKWLVKDFIYIEANHLAYPEKNRSTD